MNRILDVYKSGAPRWWPIFVAADLIIIGLLIYWVGSLFA